ncbi:MAG TPA: trypsin-like peptidase domain-containing protein, partial [Planctomycetota bacterium]|nr:trypsin-like peptidase domain-containing protein [Planctomycetota bacterium]
MTQDKRYIGQETLQRAIRVATSAERLRADRRFQIVFAVAVLLAVGAGLLLWKLASGQDSLAGDLQRTRVQLDESLKSIAQRMETEVLAGMRTYDRELTSLRGSVGADAAAVARLQVEIQTRDQAIADLRNRKDLDARQREQLAAQAEERLQQLVQRFERESTQLRQSQKDTWGDLAGRYQKAVFLVVGATTNADGSISRMLGTAFCVRKDGLLATNAHVARGLADAKLTMAIQNGSGQPFRIARIAGHPGFTGPQSPDVGLLALEGTDLDLPLMPLANDDELRAVTVGTHLGTIGYPGELAEHYFADFDQGVAKGAAATFKDGWVGRITDYSLAFAEFDKARFLQHSASTSGGTSGSPMFTADGKVVAINNAVIELNLGS